MSETKIVLAMPEHAAQRLLDGFRNNDPKLKALIEEFKDHRDRDQTA